MENPEISTITKGTNTMTENANMTQVADTTSSRGAQWAGAGSLIALAAQSLLGNGNGGLLGNILGGNGGTGLGGNMQNSAMCALMDENSRLKADAATDAKILEVYKALHAQDIEQDKFAYDLDKRLSAIETAAPLREQIVIDKINCVANTAQYGIATNSAAIQNLQTTIGQITKLGVPNSVLCPGVPPVTLSFSAATSA